MLLLRRLPALFDYTFRTCALTEAAEILAAESEEDWVGEEERERLLSHDF